MYLFQDQLLTGGTYLLNAPAQFLNYLFKQEKYVCENTLCCYLLYKIGGVKIPAKFHSVKYLQQLVEKA